MLFILNEAIKKGIPPVHADRSFKMQNKLILKASLYCYRLEHI